MSRRDSIMASAGSWPRRVVLGRAFPLLLREVPAIVGIALDLVTAELGKLTIGDLFRYFDNVKSGMSAATSANDLAVRISPALVRAIEGRKDAIMAGASGFVERTAFSLAWSSFLAQVPALAALTINRIIAEFGNYSVTDMMNYIDMKLR
jgi:hypothetical protein